MEINTIYDYFSDLKIRNKSLYSQVIADFPSSPAFNQLPNIFLLDISDQKNWERSTVNFIDNADYSSDLKYSFYWSVFAFFWANNLHDRLGFNYELYKKLIQGFDRIDSGENKSDKKRFFIYTNQYLISDNHSPTLIVNRWIEALSESGFDVVIVACTPKPFPFKLEGFVPYQFNMPTMKFNEIMKIKNGASFIQFLGVPDESYTSFINHMEVSVNDVFLLVGHSCLHFDLIASENKYVIPTSSTLANITKAKRIIPLDQNLDYFNVDGYSMDIVKWDGGYARGEHLADNLHEKKKYSFDEVNIVVVGNRLNTELETNFWHSIECLFNKLQGANLYLVGNYTGVVPEKIKSRVFKLGYANDLTEVYKSMHFFLNPIRQGGGGGARAAMLAGLPIITLPVGDVYFRALQSAYHIESYDDWYDFISDYINSSSLREDVMLIQKNLNKANRNVQKKLINLIDQIYSNKPVFR